VYYIQSLLTINQWCAGGGLGGCVLHSIIINHFNQIIDDQPINGVQEEAQQHLLMFYLLIAYQTIIYVN
jgi:hypothetical protein